MWKSEVSSTHGDRWGGLDLGRDVQSNPSIVKVVDSMIAMFV
jgi:hypothetical protein